MEIVVVLVIVVLMIGVVSTMINRGRAVETQTEEQLQETQPMEQLDIISKEERALLNAAIETWDLVQVWNTKKQAYEYYIADKRSHRYDFVINPNTLKVKFIERSNNQQAKK